MLIKQILLPGLKTISIAATMLDAQKRMKEAQIRHLPISDGKIIVGIISDRDVERATSVVNVSDGTQRYINENKKVSEYMATPVFKMKSTDTVENLIKEMIGRKLTSIIIEDEHKAAIGIVTTEDLLILLLDTLQANRPMINKLRQMFLK